MKKHIHILFVIPAFLLGFFCVYFYMHASEVKKILGISTPIPEKIIHDPESLIWQNKTYPEGFQRRDSHSMFTFQDKIWIAGGVDAQDTKINNVPFYEKATYFNDIWNSNDGIKWNLIKSHASFPPIRSASVIEFKGSLYMYGGWSPDYSLQYKNGIWKSDDGINWNQVVKKPKYTDREGQIVVKFKDKLWMIGGVDYFNGITFNDVWYSDNGTDWIPATRNAPWHSRWDHAIGILNDKIYILGGMNTKGIGYSDVWSSENGKDWTLVANETPWGKRQGQESVTLDGVMYLISGLDAKTNEGRSDVWYTRDGMSWKKIAQDGAWLGREDHGVVLFHNQIFVTGGMDSNWDWNNDTWVASFQTILEKEYLNRETTNATSTKPTITPKPEPTKTRPTPTPTPTKIIPEISALSYRLTYIDKKSNEKILVEKRSEEKFGIASITKLMTAIVASEKIGTDNVLRIPGSALNQRGSANNIKTDESFAFADLLYPLLVSSDNDTARTLAQSVGQENFIEAMNEKAQSFGMSNTKYRNETGLDISLEEASNFSTTKDLTKLAEIILGEYPDIFKITQTKEITIGSLEDLPHTFTTTNKFILNGSFYSIIGAKTGETAQAKKNLLIVIETPDKTGYLIGVVLHSDDNFGDMKKILDSAISEQSWKK